jgi:hypothetical protein
MKFIIFSFITVLFLISFDVNSKTFDIIEKNGYQVSLDWKTSGEKINVRGTIKEGKLCNNLAISLYMRHKNGATAHIYENIRYQIMTGVQFKGSDEFYKRKGVFSNKDWSVSSLNISCQK